MGVLPRAFKIAEIVQIPKDGTSRRISEFRPISLISVVGKVLEKIVAKRLSTFFDATQCIPEFQSGFKKGKSTINPISRLHDDVIEA